LLAEIVIRREFFLKGVAGDQQASRGLHSDCAGGDGKISERCHFRERLVRPAKVQHMLLTLQSKSENTDEPVVDNKESWAWVILSKQLFTGFPTPNDGQLFQNASLAIIHASKEPAGLENVASCTRMHHQFL
jgi:hypothetical protein